ncbi:MAG: 6,7-dimethyl-8-ribityllumazine synthase [Azospirillum brasilense]|nr:MAG: 6,7-dimethyl-8-ribityllumazine synthase [Azospirillum brasilense]
MKPILLVVSPYYHDIAAMLLRGATRAIEAAGRTAEVVEVPGAFEIPVAISIAHESGRYDGFVALGCVIRGETSHYDIVCNESARGCMDIALREHAAIGLGILTVENLEQAIERADPEQGDKGGEAAKAAMHIIGLAEAFGEIA